MEGEFVPFLRRNALFSHGVAHLPSSDDPTGAPGARARRRARTTSRATRPRRGRRRVIETTLVVVGCVLLAETVVGENGLVAMLRARQEYRAEVQRLEAARAEHVRLKDEARRLREDPAAIEDLARRELGLIKPGEKLFTIRDLPSAGSSAR